MSTASTHIALDIRVDGGQISGQAVAGRDLRVPFSGWLGLLGALDRLLAAETKEDHHA